MNDLPTNKLAALRAKWNAAAECRLQQAAERRWLYTLLYAFIFLLLAFPLYVEWHIGYLSWHRLMTNRTTQVFIGVCLFNVVMYPYQIYRIWAAWNRMQAAQRQREWEAAHPIPTEGVWPPPPIKH